VQSLPLLVLTTIATYNYFHHAIVDDAAFQNSPADTILPSTFLISSKRACASSIDLLSL